MTPLPFPSLAAWGVHLYTATGALLAFLSLLAALRHDARLAFAWLAVATFVDATDGVLARLADVKRHAPAMDGPRLDDIIDYLTFVFLPAFIVYQFRLVPPGWELAVVPAMLLSSAIGFALADAKSTDHFFTGFPSYWNIVALYLFVLGLPSWANAVILLGLAVLVFVRVGYIYPSRTPTWRAATLAFGALWGASMIAVLWLLPAPPRALVIGSLAFPVYYIVLSFALQRRRAP